MGTNYKMLSVLIKVKCHEADLFTEASSNVREEITGTLLG